MRHGGTVSRNHLVGARDERWCHDALNQSPRTAAADELNFSWLGTKKQPSQECPIKIQGRVKEKKAMTIEMRVALLAVGAFAMAAVLASASEGLAGDRSAAITDFSAQQEKKKTVAPKKVAPRVAPRTVAPRVVAPRVVTPRRVTPRVVTPRTVTPRTVAPKVVGPKVIGPKVAAPKIPPRVVTLSGANARVVTAAKLRGVPARGTGRAFIRGQNYSAWRSGYRVRHGGGWRTFAALSALGAIVIGTSYYYPYAYISAPQPYCEGLTEDGCQLMWQEVETIEGDVIPQCVAYCPWE